MASISQNSEDNDDNNNFVGLQLENDGHNDVQDIVNELQIEVCHHFPKISDTPNELFQ